MAESAIAHTEIRGLTRQDRGLLAAPLHSVAGVKRNLLPPLLLGGSVVCPAGVHPALLVASLQRNSPTHYWAPAATHMAILEELEGRDAPVRHALRFVLSGASSLPASVARSLERALGVPVLEGYGITEAGSIAQAPIPPARAPRGSVGRPHSIIAIMDDEDARSMQRKPARS
jgi:acyl-coenzyme A synthetase/AMP-(fatty) acid ligase